MKNMKIEKIMKDMAEGCKIDAAAVQWIHRYVNSKEKGFDEIVIMDGECVHESEVADMIEMARLLKIEYFVYASGYSSAFSVVNEMVKNGARVGKFVTKTYEDRFAAFGGNATAEVSGLRINL